MTASDHNVLTGKTVLLGVSGGVAAYKAADLASKLTQAGAAVNVVMTEAAQKFITPLTFQAVTRRRVFTSLWEATECFDSAHLSLTESADIMVVAPATANILAKMAHGLADDLLSALALSASGACPILAAPAMNTRMWQAPATQANIETLASRGVQLVGPVEGALACGTTGLGRMCEPAEILQAACDVLASQPPRASN